VQVVPKENPALNIGQRDPSSGSVLAGSARFVGERIGIIQAFQSQCPTPSDGNAVGVKKDVATSSEAAHAKIIMDKRKHRSIGGEGCVHGVYGEEKMNMTMMAGGVKQ